MAIKELFYDQRPVALLNPRASQRIDPRFKFTRQAPGSFVGSDRLIRFAQINQPRISHDPVTGLAQGLLLESGATNFLCSTDDIRTTAQAGTTRPWTITPADSSLEISSATSPELGFFPTKFKEGTTLSTNVLTAAGAASPTATTYCFSIYVKPLERTVLTQMMVQGGGIAFGATFDLAAGTVVNGGWAQGRVYTATSTIPGILPAGNGWFRIWVSRSLTRYSGVRILYHNGAPSTGNDSSYFYTGNGNSGMLFYGGQVEIGTSPSSYIKNSNPSTSVTRTADLLSIDSVSFPSSGSVYIDARSIVAVAGNPLISLANPSNEKINFGYENRTETFNSTALVGSYNGTVKSTLPLPVPTLAREQNIITWGANNYQHGLNSSRSVPSAAASVPAGLNRLSIGHDAVDPTKAVPMFLSALYLWEGEITPEIAEALVRSELVSINADTYSPVGPAGSLALIINTQGASSTGDKVFALPASRATVNATAMQAGQVYRILTVGSSNFTLVGAATNTVGTVFTATGSTTGTGTVAWQNDIVITWGDGTESGLDGAAADLGAAGLSHTYPSAGIYPVWVEGRLQNLAFNNSASAPDLVKIEAWGTTTGGNNVFLVPSTMNAAFYGCSKLTSMPTSGLPNTSAVTDWYRAFRDCSSLTGTFPPFNFSAATTFEQAFQDCSGLVSFTAAGNQTQNVTNFNSAWSGCSSLTSFPLINTSAGTNLGAAWFNCSSLTSFPLINTAAATTIVDTWRGCSSLTSFELINTSSVTNMTRAWFDCRSLTTFPLINTSSVTSLNSTWYNCYALTTFPLINTALCTDFNSTWFACFSLTSFPLINTAAGVNFQSAWQGCTGLTSFPSINTGAGTNFSRAWYNNDGLTSFPALNFNSATGSASDESTTYTGFRETWFSCGALTTFPPNLFNNTTCTRYLDAFRDCALTAASIENIIVSINAAGTSNGNLSLQGGTNAAKSTWTSAANTAYDALVARGWTITFNA